MCDVEYTEGKNEYEDGLDNHYDELCDDMGEKKFYAGYSVDKGSFEDTFVSLEEHSNGGEGNGQEEDDSRKVRGRGLNIYIVLKQ